MELKVLWTATASEQLEDIFDYYKITANLTVARKLVKGIVRKTTSLSRYPKIGQREPLLADRQKSTGILLKATIR
jgi:toxin ParE1/3/4